MWNRRSKVSRATDMDGGHDGEEGRHDVSTAGEETERRIAIVFQSQTSTASEVERAAVRAWQRPDDRFYKRVQAVFRQGVNPESEVAAALIGLESLLQKGELSESLTVWRGIRSSTRTLGAEGRRLVQLEGSEIDIKGYLPTTVDLAVAETFAAPEGPGGAAIMRFRFRGARQLSGFLHLERRVLQGKKSCYWAPTDVSL